QLLCQQREFLLQPCMPLFKPLQLRTLFFVHKVSQPSPPCSNVRYCLLIACQRHQSKLGSRIRLGDAVKMLLTLATESSDEIVDHWRHTFSRPASDRGSARPRAHAHAVQPWSNQPGFIS